MLIHCLCPSLSYSIERNINIKKLSHMSGIYLAGRGIKCVREFFRNKKRGTEAA